MDENTQIKWQPKSLLSTPHPTPFSFFLKRKLKTISSLIAEYLLFMIPTLFLEDISSYWGSRTSQCSDSATGWQSDVKAGQTVQRSFKPIRAG